MSPPPPAMTRGGSLSPALYSTFILLGQCLRTFLAAIPAILAALLAPLFVTDVNQRLLEWLAAPHITPAVFAIVVALAAGGLIVTLFLQALAMRLMGRVRPGVVSQFSFEALRIWTKTSILDSAGRWLSGEIWPWWLRFAGMRIERGCEISTIIDTLLETVTTAGRVFRRWDLFLQPAAASRDDYCG